MGKYLKYCKILERKKGGTLKIMVFNKSGWIPDAGTSALPLNGCNSVHGI